MAFSFRSLCVLAACSALLSSACVIRFGPIDDDGSSWDETTSSVIASSGSGEAGSGGEGGMGSGGDDGSGGTTSSASSGGGGEDPYCVDEVGIGQTADICDTFAVAPSTSGMCDFNEPVGYLTCQRGFEIFSPGHAENLASCISNIQTYEACSASPVDSCVTEMYDDACENSFVVDACETWGNLCSDANDSFDVATCKTQLNPFGDNGLFELVDCMNALDAPCQLRYDMCLDQVMTLE